MHAAFAHLVCLCFPSMAYSHARKSICREKMEFYLCVRTFSIVVKSTPMAVWFCLGLLIRSHCPDFDCHFEHTQEGKLILRCHCKLCMCTVCVCLLICCSSEVLVKVVHSLHSWCRLLAFLVCLCLCICVCVCVSLRS